MNVFVSSLKRGFSSTVCYGTSSFISFAIGFFTFPYILSHLSLGQYGMYDFYQKFFSISTLLLSSASSISLTRFFFKFMDDPQKQKQAIGNALLSGLIAGLSFAGVVLLVWRYTDWYRTHEYFLLVSSNIFLCIFFSLTISYLKVTEQFGWYMVLYIGQTIIATGCMLVGIAYGYGLSAFFGSLTISYLVFTPIFFILLVRHNVFSLELFKQQVRFSFPVLLYNFLYSNIFFIDRYIIKHHHCDTVLGTYAVLWRFGLLVQFISIALMDAWPVVSYNLFEQQSSDRVIARLIQVVLLAIATVCLLAICSAYVILCTGFIGQHMHIVSHLALFFVPLFFLEMARFFQTAFNLAHKTFMIPLLCAITIVLQYVLLSVSIAYQLTGVLVSNMIAFMVYALLSGWCSQYIGSLSIINYAGAMRLSVLFLIFVGLLGYGIEYEYGFIYLALVICFWPAAVWFGNIVGPDEKRIVRSFFPSWFLRPGTKPPRMKAHHYSDGIHAQRVVLCGPYPPPFGGIAVHIERVQAKLIAQNNTVIIIDTIKRFSFLRYLKRLYQQLFAARPDKIIYHSSYTDYAIIDMFIILSIGWYHASQVVLIEHDCRYLSEKSAPVRTLYRFCFNRFGTVVCIGVPTYQQYQRYQLVPRHCRIESPFLPPVENGVHKPYPKDLYAFLQHHTPIILVNAYAIRLHHGVDLYGIDMCIDMLYEIKKTHGNIGMVCVVAHHQVDVYAQQLNARMIALGLSEHWYQLSGDYVLWPLFASVDLFVRPTANENYGISVHESLFFKTPVVASNVCTRPVGTVLFTARDQQDFTAQVAGALRCNSDRFSQLNLSDQSDIYPLK